MANIASQIKRNRQNEVRRQRNQALRTQMKTLSKKALQAAEAGDADEARRQLREAQRSIDRAASKGVLHGRTAARRKSRLVGRVESLLAG
jgi:small subunit ribosomal protein S20